MKNKNVIIATYTAKLDENTKDLFNGFSLYKGSNVKVIEYSKEKPRTAKYLIKKTTSTNSTIDIWSNQAKFEPITSNIH